MVDKSGKCTMDGDKLTACEALRSSCAGPANGSKKGIVTWTFIDTKTGKPSGFYVGAKSGEHSKNGLVFNFCPFCGEKVHQQHDSK